MENAKLHNAAGLARPSTTNWWLAGLLLLSMLLPACGREPAEKRLRDRIGTMQVAASERDARDFMDGVTSDFGGNGGMDRDALHNLLRAQMLANAGINVATGPLDVLIDGDTARVRFQVVLTGGSGRFALDRAQAYDVDSGWREENGQWRVYYAQWEPKL